jgi:hypothetical protein
MKSENYDELKDKFYAGKASAEEIDILKGEGLLDDQDFFYAAMLNSEREQKMDWDFADFMKEIPATKVVALQRRGVWMKRMMAAAATVAAILLAYIFWPQHYNPKEVALVPVINKNEKTDSNANIAGSTASPLNQLKDSLFLSEAVNTHGRSTRNYTAKTRKQNLSKSSKGITKDKKQPLATNQDFMVMVNGKPITDEADAITIMKESLSLVSRKVSDAVDELKPIAQIKIKL